VSGGPAPIGAGSYPCPGPRPPILLPQFSTWQCVNGYWSVVQSTAAAGTGAAQSCNGGAAWDCTLHPNTPPSGWTLAAGHRWACTSGCWQQVTA
jgi:hypothetical protein